MAIVRRSAHAARARIELSGSRVDAVVIGTEHACARPICQRPRAELTGLGRRGSQQCGCEPRGAAYQSKKKSTYA